MATATPTAAVLGSHHQGRWYQHLYVQVLAAILIGVLLGHFYPSARRSDEAAGRRLHQDDQDAHRSDHLLHGRAWHREHEGHEEGRRVGLKALIYFEVVTTLALVIGLIVVNLWQPGVGMNVDLSTVDTKSIATYTAKAKDRVPSVSDGDHSVDGRGRLCNWRNPAGPVLRHPVRLRLQALGERGESVLRLIDVVSHVFFASSESS